MIISPDFGMTCLVNAFPGYGGHHRLTRRSPEAMIIPLIQDNLSDRRFIEHCSLTAVWHALHASRQILTA